jgi:hypothetical protein
MDSDVQAIIELTIAYTWALDTKHFDDLGDVFAEDATAVLHHVECADRAAIIARISGALSRIDVSQHFLGNHQVRIEGDTATCRCQLQAQHVRRGTEGGDNFIIGGFYEDRLVRTPAGWRISHRLMEETWREGNRAVVSPSS